MPSRCIRLTRIHAIQWFGYSDTFDIHGNLLIAGRTGAGKSVLMDLVQLILIGDQRSKYNAASGAKGEASGRDKKSYCLCDTQEDIAGVPQYARDGGVTYAALEFTWPDGSQIETWGMRIEYANSQAQTPEEEFFRVPERLERNDFISPEGFALDMHGFRAFMKKRDGETFRNVTEYRKRLSDHLNFHRDTVDFLMPSAMSFAFLPRFDEFCRRYILQAGDIKIEPIQQSYRSYLKIREELEKLQDKSDRLEKIMGKRKEWEQVSCDSVVYRFLEAVFGREAAAAEVKDLRVRLQELLARQLQQQREFERVSLDLETKSSDLESRKNLFRDSGGALLLELKERIRTTIQKIGRLEETGKNLTDEKARRFRLARDFGTKAGQFLKAQNAGNASELEYALRVFDEAAPSGLKSALSQLVSATRGLGNRVQASIAKESKQWQDLKGELGVLQEQLKNLEFNRIQAAPLLDELNRRLPRTGRDNPARQLRELCEVVDEEWRPALELAFTRKFAVVVSPSDYPEALSIYKAFSQDSRNESLVDPNRALQRNPAVLENSLAGKIETKDPVARKVADELFGQVVCVETLDELKKYPDAIMKDGFRMRGLFAERPQRYDQRPCIGSGGVAKLRAFLSAKAEECTSMMRQLDPILTHANQICQMIGEQRLDSEDMEADISAVAQLQELVVERDSLIRRNTEATSPDLEEKLRGINTLDNEVKILEREKIDLAKALNVAGKTDLENSLADAERGLGRAEKNYDDTVSRIGASLNVVRKDELKKEIQEQFPSVKIQASLSEKRHSELDSRLPGIEEALRLLREGLADQHADLKGEPDFDPNTEWNDSYGKLFHRIQVQDMKLKRQQAQEEEHRWQDLFRTTVSGKLLRAIHEVRTVIGDINLQLRKPIGDSLYHIRVDENSAREFQEYRKVLDACAVAVEGESIFASLNQDTRQAVEHVFKALVDEPEGKLAQSFLDYRSYFRYDMEVTDPKRPELPAKSLNRHADKFSGGEKQTPFYISILACYLRAYRRHLPQRYTEPSIGLVPIDEAFSKMSGERITDAIRALRDVDLQGILSMSSGNWPYAIGECDQVLAVHQREGFSEGRKTIRNIGALLNRQEALERSKEWE